MEYQKIANLIDDTPNQPSNWVETKDESRGTYNVNSQITVMHIFLLRELLVLKTLPQVML